MSLYLAVDAGGTATTYVLANQNQELARTQSGSIKRMRVSAEEATTNLQEAFDTLEFASGIRVATVDAMCIGTAGETVQLVTDWIREQIARTIPSAKLLILGDVEIALDAAFPGKRGVLALAGTGSNVCGRTSDGRLTRAGGWGPAIADQGSGYWIGREGLRQAFVAMDRGEQTQLLPAIAAAWNVETPEDLVARAHTTPPPDFSRLSRIVVDCAEEGDTTATSVLRRGGEDLAELALVVMDKVRAMEQQSSLGDQGPMPVALAGSILKHVKPVCEAMTAALHRADPRITVSTVAVDPVLGALWRARQL